MSTATPKSTAGRRPLERPAARHAEEVRRIRRANHRRLRRMRLTSA